MTDDDVRQVCKSARRHAFTAGDDHADDVMRLEWSSTWIASLAAEVLRLRAIIAALVEAGGFGVCDTCGAEVTEVVWPPMPLVDDDNETVRDCGNALLLPCGHADGYTPAGEDVA